MTNRGINEEQMPYNVRHYQICIIRRKNESKKKTMNLFNRSDAVLMRHYVQPLYHTSFWISPMHTCPTLSHAHPLKPRLSGKQPKLTNYSFDCSSTSISPRDHKAPPSMAIASPFTCDPARLVKYTTIPAISSGRPNRLMGFALAILSAPPDSANSPLAILLGKKPGQMEFTVMPRGPSSSARLRPRCSTAALLAE